MAKHRKHRRHHRRGFGSIITVSKGLEGLFDTGTVVGDALPVVIGGGVVLASMYAIRKFMPAPTSTTAQFLARNAHWVGAAATVLAGVGLGYGMRKISAGTAMVASGVMMAAAVQLDTAMMHPAAGTAGFGAIVPQFNGVMPQLPAVHGLGATVLEDWSGGHRPDSIGGAYGTDVQLSGLGAVNTSAFGTPGFNA